MNRRKTQIPCHDNPDTLLEADMKKAVKWTLILLTILSMAGYMVYEVVKPLPVALMTLSPADVSVEFRETGTVAASGTRSVFPEVSLLIASVKVEEGDMVKAGDVLVKMDTDPLTRQIASLDAQIASVDSSRGSAVRTLMDRIAQQDVALAEARRQLVFAETERTRLGKLYESGNASRSEVDAAQNASDALKSQILLIQKDLTQLRGQAAGKDSETDKVYESQAAVLRTQADALRADLEKAVVKAPVAGIVTSLAAKEGQPALPQIPLLTLLEPGEKKVEVFVLAEDVIDLRLGMPVALLQEGRSRDISLSGTVKAIAPSAVERLSSLGLSEKRVKVTLSAEGLDALVEGSDVEATFTTFEEKQVLAVPKTAVFKQDGKDAIWLARDGKASLQPVKTGLETDLDYVITEGLKNGDILVSNPNVAGLTEGKRLTAK